MSIERAFCTNKAHISAFRAYGLPDKLIWLDGRGAEDLDRCIATFRGRPGKLLIAPDARVFGQSKKAVAAVMAKLEKARVKVVDVIHPQDETVAEILHRATQHISGNRFRQRRTAQRRGRDGGLARGDACRSNRAQIDTDTLIRNLAAEHDTLGWETVIRILGGKVSESTLRRHYLPPVKRKAKRGRK